jgi:glycosyltransferase involved in cell wall biosynthesis
MCEHEPRVSVVIPIFNGAQFLAEAVQSVLDQAFGLWELILVDDGSSDHCPRIAINFFSKSTFSACEGRIFECGHTCN